MERQAQEKKGRKKTTMVLVWLLVIMVLGSIVAGGLYAREYLHQSFLAVSVEQPDLDRNEHVVQVTPIPETRDRTAVPMETTPTPTGRPTPTPSPVPTEVPTPTPTLNPLNGDAIGTGMRSPIVLDIQIRLMTLEYLDFEQPEDVYGAGVSTAVAIFQRRNGLPETGLCDKATFLKLNDENAVPYAVLPGDKGEEVRSIQERLIELGYLAAEADGSFGSETAEAVQRFRTLNKLGNGTSVDSIVMEMLFGDSPVANTLRIGDKSDQILSWQQRLLDLGYLAVKPDGTYGKLTAAAVKRFQEDNGLVADGNLGVGTLTLLNDSDVSANVFDVGDRGEDVLNIQRLLYKYGYLKSSQATGNYRDVTVAAVRQFQSLNGLQEDGKVGPETLKKLLSDSVTPAPTPTPKPTAEPTPKPTAKPTAKATAKPKTTAKATAKPKTTAKATKKPKTTAKATKKPKATAKPTSVETSVVSETTPVVPETTPVTVPEETPVTVPEETPVTVPEETPEANTPKPTAKPTTKPTEKPSSGSYGRGVEGLIAAAESRLGCPYVRGAKGPNSFDCSGFVYWCLKQAGAKVSYMTSVRWRTCSKFTRITDMSSLKRGDILVFSGSSASTGHVGIYMGSGKMIDAGSSAGCVLIRSSIFTNYWKSHFLMAYRIWG